MDRLSPSKRLLQEPEKKKNCAIRFCVFPVSLGICLPTYLPMYLTYLVAQLPRIHIVK